MPKADHAQFVPLKNVPANRQYLSTNFSRGSLFLFLSLIWQPQSHNCLLDLLTSLVSKALL